MKRFFLNIIHQPLFQFIIIGGMLFAIYYAVNPSSNETDLIIIDDEQINRMELLFEREWNRKPTQDELKGLVDGYIRQEVYYRKALRMNLDQNDEIIRRRLDQKLRFITSDMATFKKPDESELEDFYNFNKAKYMLPVKYSYSHIYFNPDKREHAKLDAEKLLPSLPDSDSNIEKLVQLGDSFPFAYHVDSLTQKEIAKEMGDGFADALKNLPLKNWSGPVLSGYGTHLIFINEVIEPTEEEFSDAREIVLRDYQYDLQEQYNTELYEEFRKDYEVRFDIENPEMKKQLLSQ